MKYFRIFVKLVACISALSLSSCGSGKDVNGSLNVTAGSVTASGGLAQVPFTISYTNPQKSDVLGVEISVTTQLDGNAPSTFSYSTSNSGTNIYTFTVLQTSSSQFLQVTARTGDLVSSASAIIPAISSTAPTLTVTPSASVAFSAGAATGTTQTLYISGGTGTYNYILNPSPNNDISVNINNNVLTVIKTALPATTGSASIIVTDTTSPTPGVVVIPVTY